MERRIIVNLDLKFNINNSGTFVQGDTDTDVLEVHLTDKHNPVDITGQDVQFWFQKSDNTVVEQDSTCGVSVIDAAKGIVQCTLNGDTLTSAGKLQVSVVFCKDNKTLSTVAFALNVEQGINSGEVIIITNEISILDQKIVEMNTEEASRITNEDTRQTNETSRQTAESSRVTAEDARISNETGRTNAESTRVTAENVRVSNEQTRQTNETTRQTGYSTMSSQINSKIQYCSYTATANNTINIPFTFTDYNITHDDMIVSYKGVLLDNPDNYTVNGSNNGIILVDWSINKGDIVKMRLYKNVR